jgi:transposase
MQNHFVGLDVHKQVIAYCVIDGSGNVLQEGKVRATRQDLDIWVKTLASPWSGAMEATMFSHWIFQHLSPYAAELKMGHPARMKAITAGKNKSDRIDARTIANLLRCELLPECFVMPPELAALRQQLRFRRTLVEETTKFKNRAASLLMEAGVEYEKKRLHGKKYFANLTQHNAWIREQTQPLLEFSREQIESLQAMDRRLLTMLERHPQLVRRIEALRQIDGVGPVTALTWALEIGTPSRFRSSGKAMSYCGLTSALRESAGRQRRGPLSKHRNANLQSALIECAKLAPMFNQKLKQVRQKALDSGADNNRATIAVARKLMVYLLAADRAFYASLAQPAVESNAFLRHADLSK